LAARHFWREHAWPRATSTTLCFEAQAREMPNFADYQQKTSRKIPVVVLERLSTPK
jgi:hypothetical protein